MSHLVFMGTPEAAVPTLRSLTTDHDVGLVVTQPDRPRGRSSKSVRPPVKQAAAELGLAVVQPTDRAGLESALRGFGSFEIGVVVAYGRILRPEVLAMPERGLLNVHFSLLPRWRGAAPVERALMSGDPMTGVTIMQMDESLDGGPVLTAQAVDIDRDENAGQLTTRLATLGARLICSSIGPYVAGEMKPVAQTDEGMTYADKIGPADRPIHPSDDVSSVLNRVRGLAPTPAATLGIDGQPHKILEVAPIEVSPPQGRWQIVDGTPVLGLADGGVEIVSIQPPGKKLLDGRAWARGHRDIAGVAT